MSTRMSALGIFLWRVTATHVITYFLVGITAMNTLNYEQVFSSGNLGAFMKSLDSPWVALGPALQVIRGLIFGLVLWPFRSIFLGKKNGWLKLWALFIGLSILATFGPALGSLDGMIYTTIPIMHQLLFLPELIFQSFLLSFLVVCWNRKPKRVYNILSIIFCSLILLMSIAGYLSLSS